MLGDQISSRCAVPGRISDFAAALHTSTKSRLSWRGRQQIPYIWGIFAARWHCLYVQEANASSKPIAGERIASTRSTVRSLRSIGDCSKSRTITSSGSKLRSDNSVRVRFDHPLPRSAAVTLEATSFALVHATRSMRTAPFWVPLAVEADPTFGDLGSSRYVTIGSM